MSTVIAARRTALVPAVAMLATMLCGCAPHRLAGACGIVVDATGSSDAQNGFNAQQEIKKHVPGFLGDGGCRTVAFAPISGDSLTSRCQEDPIDIDPDVTGAVDRNALRASQRDLAAKQADALRACVRADKRSAGGSDILGGLSLIARERPAGGGLFRVLVISDFLAADSSINLYRADLSTSTARAAAIRKVADRIPDLSGVQITADGYGMLQSSDPGKYRGFDLFWRQLLKERAKASDPLIIL